MHRDGRLGLHGDGGLCGVLVVHRVGAAARDEEQVHALQVLHLGDEVRIAHVVDGLPLRPYEVAHPQPLRVEGDARGPEPLHVVGLHRLNRHLPEGRLLPRLQAPHRGPDLGRAVLGGDDDGVLPLHRFDLVRLAVIRVGVGRQDDVGLLVVVPLVGV